MHRRLEELETAYSQSGAFILDEISEESAYLLMEYICSGGKLNIDYMYGHVDEFYYIVSKYRMEHLKAGISNFHATVY